ncbi:Interferon-induced very large GTPase 1-like isoform X2 [Oopsacas minuta]|uniref:Interferon-induced very large GTPase 1-like isoform X2 n=1 Tax=Oopsacas minuta TaxID=111878 RepID=A0AAV7KKA1_9METZ|nr:Interferon-induced very large GTPase 1-like isoform X2 [Oopsacas minuta]
MTEFELEHIQLQTEHYSFSHCTRIKRKLKDLERKHDHSEGDKSLSDYAEEMLDKILGLDQKSRNVSIEILLSEDSDELCDINSMDIFIKLFLECNYIFRPIFITQATKCQLSLPLVVSNPRTKNPTFFSIPYHSIMSQSYFTPEGKAKIIPIFTEEIYFISFIRIGPCHMSYKSVSINDILGLNGCFISHVTKGSSTSRVLCDGLIEMNWFLPRNSPPECFHEPLMFLNLRGDALEHRKQLNFILDVSSLVYIFINLSTTNQTEIQTILNTHKHKTCLVIMDCKTKSIANYRPLTEQQDKNWYFIAKQNLTSIPREITASINGILGKHPDITKISLYKCKSVALKHQMDADDESEDIKLMQGFQEKFHQIFRTNETTPLDLAYAKSIVLPLQLKPWENRSKAVRRQSCIKSNTSLDIEKREQILRDLRKHLNLAREEQISYLLGPIIQNEFILTVLTMIKANIHNSDSLTFLWRILQTSLDCLSLEYALVTYTDSLGVEHVMRELGQVYESFINARLKRDDITKILNFNVADLAIFAAKLIISGHSFELLDGAVSHVSLIWVSAVIKELSKLIGENKRVFVVGILGIQSSGKSTLLNTMFGLQFPVRTGRCTRGIFMQMIAVDRDSELGYDYLLVLDTEGLNAPELIGIVPDHHDNELATFVVGLSDLTIVNLLGENESKFKDILQITVLALIRMQLAYAKPKCIFVHQNVADLAAKHCMTEGRQRLINLLDENTQIAAEQEGFTRYKRFSDVIDYDINDDTYYLPCLFSVQPPMSIVCSEYSKQAEVLRNKITHQYSQQFNLFLNLSDWSKKLKHIWNALLTHNFVLGYKNILELCASIEFDEVLNKWAVYFDTELINLLNQAKDDITNANSIDIQSVYLASKHLLDVACTAKAKDEQAETLNYLFNKSTNREIFSDWKERADEFFTLARQRKRARMFEKIEHHVILRREALSIDERFFQIRDEILQKAKDDMISINAKDDWSKPIQHLENLFEDHWNGWDATLTKECEKSFPIDIKTDLQYTLRNFSCFKTLELSEDQRERLIRDASSFAKLETLNFQLGSNHYTVFNSSTKEIIPTNCTFIDYYDYVSHYKTKQNIERNDLLQDRITTFIEFVSMWCNKFLFSLSKSDPYSINSFNNLIEIILNQIEEFNEKERNNVALQIILKDLFMFEFCLYHCCKALPQLEKLHQTFVSQANTKSQLQNLKNDLQPIFLGVCQGVQMEISCAKALAEIVFQKMNYFLENKLGADVIHFFQNDVANFDTFKRRSSLQIQVLKDLARNRNFQMYISYISDPVNYIRKWIEVRFTTYCSNEERHKEFKVQSLEPSIAKLKEFYKRSLSDSVNTSKIDWKNIFFEKIKSHTKELRKNDFNILEVYQNPIQNTQEFVEYFLQSFENMCTPCNWLRWIKGTMSMKLYSNTKYLIKLLIRCQSLCPFCREPCILSSHGHKHYCGSLHRPKGLAGYYHQTSYTFSVRECTQSMNTDDTIVYNNGSYKYTDYALINEDFASWNILGEDAIDSKYWQWVFYTFRYEFIEHYKYKYNPAIENWSYLTDEDVLSNLDMHNENFLNKTGGFSESF